MTGPEKITDAESTSTAETTLHSVKDESGAPPAPPATSAPLISAPPPPLPPQARFPTRTHIPHMGHAALFLLLTLLGFIVAEALVLASAGMVHRDLTASLTDPLLQLIASAIAYIGTLLVAGAVFAPLWQQSFRAGTEWNALAARTHWIRLCLLGLGAGIILQVIESFVHVPRDLPVELYFRSPATLWAVTAFGTLLAPLFEELTFRGFLLPAFAIAFDYARLPKTPEGHARWTSGRNEQANAFHSTCCGGRSTAALVVSSLLTSALFALIHAPQLGYAWPLVSLLAVVSVLLCVVRLRTNSVAASTLVHAAYNFSVFVTLFVVTGGYRHLERAR